MLSNPANTAEFNANDTSYHGVTDEDKLTFVRDYLRRFGKTLNPIMVEALVFFESALVADTWDEWAHDRDKEPLVLAEFKPLKLDCAFTFRGRMCGVTFSADTRRQKYCKDHSRVVITGVKCLEIAERVQAQSEVEYSA